MPTRSAICVCVIDSKNRSSSTVRSRSGNAASNGRNASRFSIWSRSEVDVAERVGDRGRLVVSAAAAVDRQRVVGTASDEALDDLVAVHLELLGQFRCGGCAAEPLRQFGGRGAQPQMQFLESAGHLDRPAVVPEVPSDLAHDGRHRERHEVRPGVDIEPDHRIHQAHPRDLDQVVAGFSTPVEAAGDVVGQREAALDDPVPLPLKRRRIFGYALEFTEHVRDIRVLRVRP